MSNDYNLIHRVNVGDIVKRSAARFPQKTALVEGDRRITYRECNQMVNKVARGLLSLGLEKGDRLAILLSNSIEFVLTYFACAKAGVTVVPINLSLLPHEVSYIISDSRAKAAVVEIAFLEKLITSGHENVLRDIVLIGGAAPSDRTGILRYHDWEAVWSDQEDTEVCCEVDDRDLMQCLYTSGTTSHPKGVMSSHIAVYMNTLGTAFDMKFTEIDVSVAMLPQFHVAQLNAITTPVFIAGGTTVIMKKFEPVELMTLVQREAATQIFGLPMMYRALLDHPHRSQYDLSTLRLCVYAMAPMPNEDLQRAHETFKCDFALLFGQTEMAPVATVFRPEHQLIKPGAVGTPAVNVEVGIMNAQGELLPTGSVGEIVYRSPQTMEGYLNDPQKTAEAFAHGWFHSGDEGYFDEDNILWFGDRKKDMVKTGGVNVASIEVEKVIFQHPRVQNVAVVGLPHARWSEALTAFVISNDGGEISEEEIIQLCKDKLGGFKVPKRVLTVKEFPMTSTGKIQKNLLRAEFAQAFAELEHEDKVTE
ncbi:long-chain-fatty-acid--CoA ligase [Brevibacillus choshinensis]|uniref:long-chain-fatty-acid--CoA ligase n=1 Tax=Brevibacillus choshinensis TaxID=54911 RepID=UPI002E1D72E6|nr:long-chain-fatty-acid--CoA ligase [Brevibacillus choshinensis]